MILKIAATLPVDFIQQLFKKSAFASWMVQKSRLRTGPQNLTFVGFRVRSDGAEYVDDFIIYFDQIKYMSNSMSFIYDGYELKDMDFGDSESSANSSAEAK